MTPRDSDREWERLGQRDPYYGVLSQDRFRSDRVNDDSLREFFKSGQDHIDFVLETIRTSVDPNFSPSSALDFGCGVGRCSIPLARVCQSVVGVDVSESMLQEARRNCKERSILNLELVQSDDELSSVSDSFDLIHSFLVFQHIPPRRGERIFARLIELLSGDGVAAVQFVYHRSDPAVVRRMGTLRRRVPLLHNFVNLLYGKPFADPLMEKNAYDLNHLFVILQEHGVGKLHVEFHGHGTLRNVALFFQKKRDMTPARTLDA